MTFPTYPHHHAIAQIARRFNADPHFQYKLHLIATYVWLLNMLVAASVFVFAQGFWARFSVFYLVLISLYANFATDYGAVPASEAAIHGEALTEGKITQ
jgi:hypothetical protein